MKGTLEFLNEGVELNLNESSLDKSQIADLVQMTIDGIGRYSSKNADDASEFIMSMGEDIPGFGTREFNAVFKAYRKGKVNEATLCEECGKTHLDEACDLSEASMAFGRVSNTIAKNLKGMGIKFKTDFDGSYDSFYRLDNQEVSIVVDSDSIMVSSESGDYKEFKHRDISAATTFANSIL